MKQKTTEHILSAFAYTNAAIGQIEEMKWSCDGELYDLLLEIKKEIVSALQEEDRQDD